MKILTFLLCLLCFTSLEAKVLESEQFFKSALFIDYHRQSKTAILPASHPEEAKFAAYITTYLPGKAEQNRAFYTEMIDKLRALIEKRPKSAFVDHFCVWFFESAQIWDGIADPHPYPDQMDLPQLFAITKKIYTESLADPSLNGCQKSVGDQLRFGNVPYALYQLGQTKVLRLPCVTRMKNKQLIIAEEFSRYLSAQKKKHLYINLITHKNGKPGSVDEKIRAKIETLEQEFSHVYTATLDKNSPFYFQSGEFAAKGDAAEFLRTFQAKLFAKNDPLYHWPKALNQAQWQKSCERLLKDIHSTYYQSRPSLSVEERKDFIHIVYIEIVKELVKTLEPATMNISCMNTVDRGISLLCELYLDQILQKKNTISREEAAHFNALLLTHPIVFRNRPAHDYRIERVLSAITRMH